MGGNITNRKIPIIQADILYDLPSDENILILHGCNCFHIMGAGIAKYLRSKYPVIYKVDSSTPYGDRGKLGTVSYAYIRPGLSIGNCYTQFDLGSKRHPAVNYDAIRSCLMNAINKFPYYSFRMPKIGCGLAGGKWDKVEKIYLEVLENHKFSVYEK